MPEKTPPVYQWAVTFRDIVGHLTVEAAYSVIEDSGHMVLKGADHNPVFTAEPGLGCTFERRGVPGQAEADHWTVEPAPGRRYRVFATLVVAGDELAVAKPEVHVSGGTVMSDADARRLAARIGRNLGFRRPGDDGPPAALVPA